MGASGREILAALVAGNADPSTLADLACGKLRAKPPQLQRALVGEFGAHQHFLLARQLTHLDALDELIEQLSAEVEERLRPVRTPCSASIPSQASLDGPRRPSSPRSDQT
jgi:transposase